MTTRPRPRLFELYTMEQLAALTPYSAAYLEDLARRPERIRPHFRRVISQVLGKSEAELFGVEASA